jgi:transcriptional regulator GlxA family with amidase domain
MQPATVRVSIWLSASQAARSVSVKALGKVSRATGSSVLQWLTHQRLTLAGRLLETTDRSIESVAADAGFGSALSLRQHFAARFGVSPVAYRRE